MTIKSRKHQNTYGQKREAQIMVFVKVPKIIENQFG